MLTSIAPHTSEYRLSRQDDAEEGPECLHPGLALQIMVEPLAAENTEGKTDCHFDPEARVAARFAPHSTSFIVHRDNSILRRRCRDLCRVALAQRPRDRNPDFTPKTAPCVGLDA